MLREEAANLLTTVNLGSGVAEDDDLLEAARIETSVFGDLLRDRVDLVPGTKGSGKTALYRMFVEFLPNFLLEQRRVVVAHGVQRRHSAVFLAYKEQFDTLSEADFIDFWCVYLISLAYEQFIRSSKYAQFLKRCDSELTEFRQKYGAARIPEFEKRKTLLESIGWAIAVVKSFNPKVAWKSPDGQQFELSLDIDTETVARKKADREHSFMSPHIDGLTLSLENLLTKADLSLWLMIDRLDELFARRSKTEQRALRGLLRAIRLFRSDHIRVKVFLRDDILEHIVSSYEGFTSLSHVDARSANTLRWSENQILALVVRRIFASVQLKKTFAVDDEKLQTSTEYQRELFYKVFSDTVHRPPQQSPTLRWIYNHTKDGRGVVTPRDVISLLTRACQWQRDEFNQEPEGETERLILGPAIIYGLEELSKQKRIAYLQAEFPHKWSDIEKLVGGHTEYGEAAMKSIFGKEYKHTIEDLVALGIVERSKKHGAPSFKIPYLYRHGLECTQRYRAM